MLPTWLIKRDMVDVDEVIRPQAEYASTEPLAQFIPIDEMTRLRVQRFIQETGATALSSTVEASEEVRKTEEGSRFPTLMDALHAAHSGDMEARKVVENNAQTQVWEALMKHIVMEMRLTIDDRGRLVQNGQLLRDVQGNALLFASESPKVRKRTYAEISNFFVMEHLVRSGKLDPPEGGKHTQDEEAPEGKRIVVVSRFPDDMSEEAAGRVGFFRETMACSIQMLYMKGGEVVQKSGFVAGRASADAPRHDQQAINYMLQALGVPAENLSATELLGRPLLVDSSVDMATLIRLYDEGAGGTFFGLHQPKQDYHQAMQEGRKRLERLKTTVEQVVTAVMAKGKDITHPLAAIKLLHEEAQRIMVDLALEDDSIEARVFHEGAQHIEAARHYFAIGDMESFQKERQLAHETSRTTSCPVSSEEDAEGGSEQEKEAARERARKAAGGTGKISKGYCITDNCPTQPKKTWVGECFVCLCCQDLWDHDIDPATVYRPRHTEKTQGELLMASIQALLAERERTQKEETVKEVGRLAVAA